MQGNKDLRVPHCIDLVGDVIANVMSESRVVRESVIDVRALSWRVGVTASLILAILPTSKHARRIISAA